MMSYSIDLVRQQHRPLNISYMDPNILCTFIILRCVDRRSVTTIATILVVLFVFISDVNDE